MSKIKLIVSDVDGVWTDGGVYYGSEGEELKKFSFRDGGGVVLASLVNLPVVILSGEDSNSVKHRMQKLKITNVHLGIKNKRAYLQGIVKKMKIDLCDVAYIGDDINDLGVIELCGYTSCPSDSATIIKQVVDNILLSPGGSGAFREFVEDILKKENLYDLSIAKYKELKI